MIPTVSSGWTDGMLLAAWGMGAVYTIAAVLLVKQLVRPRSPVNEDAGCGTMLVTFLGSIIVQLVLANWTSVDIYGWAFGAKEHAAEQSKQLELSARILKIEYLGQSTLESEKLGGTWIRFDFIPTRIDPIVYYGKGDTANLPRYLRFEGHSPAKPGRSFVIETRYLRHFRQPKVGEVLKIDFFCAPESFENGFVWVQKYEVK